MSDPADLGHYMEATARMRDRAERAEAERDALAARLDALSAWRHKWLCHLAPHSCQRVEFEAALVRGKRPENGDDRG